MARFSPVLISHHHSALSVSTCLRSSASPTTFQHQPSPISVSPLQTHQTTDLTPTPTSTMASYNMTLDSAAIQVLPQIDTTNLNPANHLFLLAQDQKAVDENATTAAAASSPTTMTMSIRQRSSAAAKDGRCSTTICWGMRCLRREILSGCLIG